MTERGAAPRPLRMRIALSPRRHAALYAALQTLPPPARTPRLLTLATVGLALGTGAVTLLPRTPAGTAAGLLLRVGVPRQTCPELHQALAALPSSERRDAFLAWAQAGLAQLHAPPPTPRAPPPVTAAAAPAPPPPAAAPVLLAPAVPPGAPEPPAAPVRRLVRNMGLAG